MKDQTFTQCGECCTRSRPSTFNITIAEVIVEVTFGCMKFIPYLDDIQVKHSAIGKPTLSLTQKVGNVEFGRAEELGYVLRNNVGSAGFEIAVTIGGATTRYSAALSSFAIDAGQPPTWTAHFTT